MNIEDKLWITGMIGGWSMFILSALKNHIFLIIAIGFFGICFYNLIKQYNEEKEIKNKGLNRFGKSANINPNLLNDSDNKKSNTSKKVEVVKKKEDEEKKKVKNNLKEILNEV